MKNAGIIKSLMEEHDKLYNDLTKTFTDKSQFELLNKLIDTEIELEKLCGE